MHLVNLSNTLGIKFHNGIKTKKEKTLMKKLMALLLSLVTVLSMTCIAFAGEMPAPSNTYPAEYEYFDDGSYIVTTIT